MDYVAARYAHNSPLAKKLFAVDGVNRVFYGGDHISVGKTEDFEWNVRGSMLRSYSWIVEMLMD